MTCPSLQQLAGLLISRQIIGNLRESAWPYMVEQWRLATLSFKMWGALSPTQSHAASIATTQAPPLPPSDDSNNKRDDSPFQSGSAEFVTSKRSIGQAEIESSLYKYDGTFSDHLEMLVQMGYVVLFSAAFPLAGLCALANNILEIRSDAFKLVHVHQRPFGQRVANIGTWQNALGFLGLAAVIVNCALIGLSGQVSRLWPGLTSTQTVVLIVTLEHIMLGLRSALTWLLPELPSWLASEIARAEQCRRDMQCKGMSPRQTPPSCDSSHGDSNLTPDQPNVFVASNDEQYIDDDIDFDQILNQSVFGPSKCDHSSLTDSVFEEDVVCDPYEKSNSPPASPISQVCNFAFASTVCCWAFPIHTRFFNRQALFYCDL